MSEQFGRYTLLKRLGGGGMGEVYLARTEGLGGFEKLCVVKMLLPSLAEDDRFARMFLDEARLAARLSHPNACQVFDVGQVDGSLYMAMEHVGGDDLSGIQRRLAEAGLSMPPAFAARVVADAAAGLQHAHQLTDANGRLLGLIHRDVSPPNVIVSFDGEVKVIDFGLARAAGRLTHTKDGVLKGKYAYMSPEQVAGEPIDHRSDVFALGVVLHELLTGERLFKRAGDTATLAAVAQCDVPLPSSRNREVPSELDQVVLGALAKDRERRFRDAQALRFALEEWLRVSREPSSSVHLSKFMHQLYRDRLDTERARGRLWDAPEGPVSRIRAREKVNTVSLGDNSKPTQLVSGPPRIEDDAHDAPTRTRSAVPEGARRPSRWPLVVAGLATAALFAALAYALAG
jgi:serine/threonine protein kinase